MCVCGVCERERKRERNEKEGRKEEKKREKKEKRIGNSMVSHDIGKNTDRREEIGAGLPSTCHMVQRLLLP